MTTLPFQSPSRANPVGIATEVTTGKPHRLRRAESTGRLDPAVPGSPITYWVADVSSSNDSHSDGAIAHATPPISMFVSDRVVTALRAVVSLSVPNTWAVGLEARIPVMSSRTPVVLPAP